MLSKIIVATLIACTLVAAFVYYRWTGVLLVTSAWVLWSLMHVNRMILVLKRTADRPMGYVGSAVMLHARLKPGVTLLHVVAMTRALGELQSPKDTQPEMYRWTDGSQSHVTCEFLNGKLTQWALVRPEPVAASASAALNSPAA